MSKKKIYKTISVGQTQQAARDIISNFLSTKRSSAFVLALSGDLGTGKTHFTKGIAGFFGVTRQITSPTFVIMKRYDIATENSKSAKLYGIKHLYHFDAYRIAKPRELIEIGWRAIVRDAVNLIIVEWADRVRDIIPPDAVWVEFKSYNEKERMLIARSSIAP